jgi:hypothetical protein
MQRVRDHRTCRRRVTRSCSAALALAVCLASVSWVVPGHALDGATRSTLRQMSADGVTAYQAADYDTALEKLNRAWGILQTAPLGLWSGRALEKTGRLVEASERYLAAVRAPVDAGGDLAAQEAARKEADEAYHAIKPRIPTLTVYIEGSEPVEIELTVGGRAILVDFIGELLAVDPGEVVVVGARGNQVQNAKVSVVEGQAGTVTLTFDPDAEPQPDATEPQPTPADEGSTSTGPAWQKVAGWTGVGLGGAGLVLGGVTGGILFSKWSELDCGQTSQMCNANADETGNLNTLRTVSTIGFIAGGVLAAVGVTLLVTAPRKERTAWVRPYFAGDTLGFAGAF